MKYLFPLEVGSLEALVGGDALLVARGGVAQRAAANAAGARTSATCRPPAHLDPQRWA